MALLLLAVLHVPLLSGCWDRHEIEDRALILGLAIDEVSNKEDFNETKVTHLAVPESVKHRMIRLTAQIAVPGRVPLGPGTGGGGDGGGKGTDSMPVWVVQVYGHSIDDCLNNLQQEVADPKTLIHLRVIIISKEIAQRGLSDINDYLRRNPEVRRSTWLLVSDQEAAKFMNVSPPLERVPTLYLLGMIERSVAMGKFPEDTIGQFWSAQSKLGKDSFLPYISIRNEDNILIKGIAYFKADRLAGTTLPHQIASYMEFKGLDPGGYSLMIDASEKGGVMLNVTRRETKIDMKIKNGQPAAYIKAHVEAKLVEKETQAMINTSESLQQIEKQFNQSLELNLHKFMHQLQQDKSDIVGLGEIVRAYHSQYWRKNIHSKEEWEEVFSKIPIEIKVECKVRRVGLKSE
ncbi:spore gernimation protein GerC [Paenibacillus yonginensis]|uniref:Spore gernimation protein GerC n=2 Tax=Paenibacillus yonginensis TaxID=1462996 RepID=A0A1B1N6I8_9BACL|nr:spore gernimation protein GerC [Paenibacillus yonginensis]